MANILDGPLSGPTSRAPPLSSSLEAAHGTEAVHLPAVLDMAAVAWQSRRAPKASKASVYENRYTSGACVNYLNEAFVDNIFAGVLKVTVLNVASGPKPLDKTAGIRVTFKDRQAIAGFHSAPDDGRGTAYLWLHKGEEGALTSSFAFEHVKARDRESLAENDRTKTISTGTLNIDQKIPVSPALRNYTVVLFSSTKEGELRDVDVKVAVSFVPLNPASPDEAASSEEGAMLRHNIGMGAMTFNPKDSEVISLGSLPAFDESERKDSLYQAAFTLGQLFEGGFWVHGRGAEPVAYIQNKASSTELLVFWNQDLKQIAVAFDSTKINQFEDFVTDLNIRAAVFDESGAHDAERFRAWLRIFRGTRSRDKQLVHLGFLRAWRSVQHATETLIRQAVGAEEGDAFRNCEWKTLFTGHSLGGALATLATASAVAKGRKGEQVGLYTFGCPRVGNATFLEGFREKVPESLRIFNSIDSISFAPRSTGFSATTPAMSLVPSKDTDGVELMKLAFPDAEPVVTVLPGQKIPPEVESKYIVQYPHIKSYWDRVKFEAQLLFNIVSLRGVKAHDTDAYVASLIGVARDICLKVVTLKASELPLQALSDLQGGVKDAQRLLDRFRKPAQSTEATETTEATEASPLL